MPDLRPDTSIFTKPQSQSTGDVLGLLRGYQQLETARAIGDATTGSIKDGKFDQQEMLTRLKNDPRYKLGSPSDVITANQAGQGQLSINADTAGRVALEMDRLVALGDKVTPEEVNRTRMIVASQMGPSGVQTFDQFLRGARNPQDIQAKIQLAKAGLGIPQTYTERPGAAGPPEQVPAARAQYETATGQGGGGAPGTPGGAQDIDVGAAPHARGTVPSLAPSKSFGPDQEAAGNLTQRTQPLVNALASMRGLPKNAFGPGSHGRNTAQKIIQNLGLGSTFGIAEGDTSTQAYDKVVKAVAQYNDTISGGQTDARLYQATMGNPNPDMEKATIEQLLRVSLGLERMRAATFGEFGRYQQRGWAPSEYDQFKTKYNQKIDQRAFVFQTLGRDQAAALLKTMKPGSAERRRFEQSLDVAKRQIVPTPEGGQYTPE